MAESDWTVLADSLSTAVVKRAPTTAFTPPGGGGLFTYVMNSTSLVTGAVGLFSNQVNFAPMAKGGSITMAMQRGPSGGPTGWTPMLYIGLQGTSVNDTAYILGLSDGDPSHLVLRKGTIAAGIPDLDPDPVTNGILLKSTSSYAIGQWAHARLDMIVEDNGDVILQVFENDLDTNPIGSAPVWVTPAGMEGDRSPEIDGFIDDAAEINTGSAPLTSGRAGFATQFSDVTRRAYFDHWELTRDTA